MSLRVGATLASGKNITRTKPNTQNTANPQVLGAVRCCQIGISHKQQGATPNYPCTLGNPPTLTMANMSVCVCVRLMVERQKAMVMNPARNLHNQYKFNLQRVHDHGSHNVKIKRTILGIYSSKHSPVIVW